MKSRIGRATDLFLDKLLLFRGGNIMNIKIADRLVRLRKEKGLSQEELADKLGLSRQAVSKWERAEASPDTDNLICLAKLYGVSLDELLQDDDDIETIVKEQVKDKQKEKAEDTKEDFKEQNEEKKTSSVHIGKDGIHVVDDEDEVHIDNNGIHITENGKPVHFFRKEEPKTKTWLVISILSGSYFFMAILAMVLIGCLVPNGWSWSWTFLLLVPVVGSIPSMIKEKRLTHFCYPLFVTFIYLLICLAVTPIWHPLWVLFLTIPLYYMIVGPIDKYNESKRKNKVVIDIDVEDK